MKAGVGFSQNRGETEQKALRLIRERGFALRSREKSISATNICMKHMIGGGLFETAHFLGRIRPERLLRNFYNIVKTDKVRIKGYKPAPVLRRSPAGYKHVIDITTTTGTFLANGFVVHNCGPSGWKLDGWLASAGVSRAQCFVGNVAQVRPGPKSNEFHLFEWNGAAVQEGIAALRSDLARFAPHCVVALGNAALHLLRHGNCAPPKSAKLGLFQWSSHVGTWRGSLFRATASFDAFEAADLRVSESAPAFATFKAISTYHPAATFREPSFAYPLVSDLKRAVAEARTPVLDLPVRDIRWGLSAEEVEARCAAIRAARTAVGFDIEGGLKGLQCCSFATSPHEAFVIDLMDPALERSRLLRALAGVLEDERVPKVCWNAAYERCVLEAVASIRLQAYEDAMIAWWERFSELPKGLDFVASLLTREPYWAEGIGWDKRTGLPKVTGAPFWRYNGIDSCVTLEIWQHPIVRAVVESRAPAPFAL
jgi:uracil-DNA glycosylase